MVIGRDDILQAIDKSRLKKEKVKEYRDTNRNVRPNNVKQGDLVLLRRNTTKHKSMYDPEPYLVVKIEGAQIQGTREGCRDKT